MQTKNQLVLFVIITAAIIFLLALVIVTLLYFYQKRQLVYQKNLNSLKIDFEKNLLKTQVEIQEQTFQHISREIHDNINLSLTLAKLNLTTAGSGTNEKIRETLISSVNILGSVITELNNLSKSINTDQIKELGLTKAIANEIDRLKNITGLQINYQVKGEPLFLDTEKELVIFRIIQEAFNNIIKHSKAGAVTLKLDYKAASLEVLVEDDGVGFEQNQVCPNAEKTGAGLTNMKKRAELFGGAVSLDSRLGKGTKILITIPYNR